MSYEKEYEKKCGNCGGNIWVYGDDAMLEVWRVRDHDPCRIFFSHGKAFCSERCVDDYLQTIRWSRRQQ